jgi:hypothetical protein
MNWAQVEYLTQNDLISRQYCKDINSFKDLENPAHGRRIGWFPFLIWDAVIVLLKRMA